MHVNYIHVLKEKHYNSTFQGLDISCNLFLKEVYVYLLYLSSYGYREIFPEYAYT